MKKTDALIKRLECFTNTVIRSRREKLLQNLSNIADMSCVEKFASTYSYGFMIQLITSMAAICAVMVQLSLDASSLRSIRLMVSLAFFGAMITQLALQCFTGNELTYQAERVSEAVMCSKWERMPVRLRRDLVLVIVRSQRPLQLTAAGFAVLNNDCFVSIMKAAYSYYAVLSQAQP